MKEICISPMFVRGIKANNNNIRQVWVLEDVRNFPNFSAILFFNFFLEPHT